MYIQNYFTSRKSKISCLWGLVKSSINSVIAATSIWFPSLRKLVLSTSEKLKENTSRVQDYVYSNVLDKFTSGIDEKKIILADFVITPPNRRTTGLLEDMQIIIQIALD